jgi:hypothetical protein
MLTTPLFVVQANPAQISPSKRPWMQHFFQAEGDKG